MDKPGARFERRQFPRIDGTFVVSYGEALDDRQKIDITQTRNISEGGLLFTTDRKFQSGIVLKLKLRLPGYPDYITLKVEVVESKEIAGKGFLYDTRVKFISIKDEIKDVIRKIVDTKMGGPKTQGM